MALRDRWAELPEWAKWWLFLLLALVFLVVYGALFVVGAPLWTILLALAVMWLALRVLRRSIRRSN